MAGNFNPKVNAIGDKTYYLSDALLANMLKEVHEADEEQNSVYYLYTAAIHAGAALSFIARAIAPGEAEDKASNATKETMLVAALIAARAVLPKADGVDIDWTTRNVAAAVKAAEKLAGYPIAPYLDQELMAGVHIVAADKSLEYWDYLDNVGPQFGDIGDQLRRYTKH